jgi:hypothetical protein
MHARAWLIVLAWAFAACAPALDWRESRPEGADLVALFPCKPEKLERRVEVAGQQVQMRLQTCAAAGHSFALGYFRLEDPGRIGPALAALQASMADNLGAQTPGREAWSLVGANAQPEPVRLALSGRLSDNTAAEARAVFFAKGLTVYQASVVAARLDESALEPFFAGLRPNP